MTATADDQRREEDLVGVLLDAHARGHGILESAVHMLETEVDDEVAAHVAATVHRFLTFTNPQHELDEEQMIFPALRAAGRQEEVAPALAHLVEAHMVFDARRDELAGRWERVARNPGCLRDDRSELLAMTEKLARALEQHRQHEDLVVFPLIRKYVPVATQARILAVLSRREARS
jgi:iron-sulfur cluster repair protein YtfE (RIC family)